METVSEMLVKKMTDRGIIVPEKREVYKTGIMLLLADLINFALVLLIGILCGALYESALYLLMMWTVRRFSGGYHAKTYGRCRAVTVGTYILVLISENLISDNFAVIALVCNAFAIVTGFVFSPVRHPNRELTEKERKANRLFAVLATLFFAAASIVLTLLDRKEGLAISLILLAIAVLMYAGMLANGKEGKRHVKDHG